MSVKTPAEFLEVIEKSKLLSEQQMVAARKLGDQESDPKNIARSLLRDGVLNKWQALHLLAGRSALTLGKYKLLDQMNADDRQRVFLAEHAESGRKVAIQTLPRLGADQNSDVASQLQEKGRQLAALEHPSIVPFYEVSAEGDRCFLVTEQPRGRNLQQIIDEKGPLPTEQAVGYLSQTLEALAYSHESGVSHGDLRPTNILVDDQGQVRVANLGVSALMDSGDETTGEDSKSKTPDGFAPPKEWSPGERPGQDRDLYSLGAVMYAMLTGKVPAGNLGSVSLVEQRPDAPESLVQCFQKLTASDPVERFASLVEAGKKLRPAVSDAPAAGGSADVAANKPASVAAKVSAPTPPKRKPVEKAAQETTDKPAEKSVAAVAATKDSPKQPASEKSEDSKSKIIVPGLPDASAAIAATPSTLAINTKAKRRPPKSAGGMKPPAKKPSGTGDAEATPQAAPVAKAGIPKLAYVIGGASLAGIVLLAAAVFAVMSMMSGGDQVQIAEAPPAAEAGNESDPARAATTSTDSAESDPALDLESDPLPVETDPEPPVMPTPVEPAPKTTVSEPASGDSTETVPADAVPETSDSGNTEVPSKPVEEPKPADTTETPPEPATPEKPKPEPPATETKQEPEKPKPEPPAKPKPPAKKAFADLPAVVSLPALDAADALEPKTLGQIYATRDDQCFIRMRGGEGAFKGNRVFAMRNADGGTAERDWEINLRDASASSETKIAHLSLNDKFQLVFQWQPAAKDDSAAAHLINCALSMTSRGETHVLLLRQPTKTPALEIDLKEPPIRQGMKFDTPPDPGKIRVELTGVKGVKSTIEPQPVFNAEKGEAWIKLQDGGGLVSLKVETDMKRELQLLITPHVQLNPDGRPERLVVRQVQQSKAQLQAAVAQWGMLVQQGQAIMKSKAPEQQKKQTEQYLRNYENELKTSQETLAKFEAFEQLLEKNKPQIGFRVFYDADGSEINLLVAGS